MNRLGGSRADGFTIIEVIFFLAISGALITALLGTVGFAVTRQRFTDSIIGAQGYFQSQYNETLNVINDRQTGSCSVGGGGTTIISSASGQRGTSSGATTCVVLGKALEFSHSNPNRITSYLVVGHEPAEASDQTGAALLAQYAPTIDKTSAVTDDGAGQIFDIAWDAKVTGIRKSGSDGGLSRLLLLRSPDSGLVMTFAGGDGTNLLPALTAGTGMFTVCIQSADVTNAISALSLSPVAGTEGVTTKFDLTSAEQEALC